ncbi:DUF6090 family protein [Algoriphagus halophilus]|uniref:Uncharacterized protein n=1 Tax=Algoriphagus halophilus TaxID=226505 RepID=A0A1N6FYR1_9BACT|nr:DUF6090 family protein [Algoriphagus halophilus]SIO00357.1 hypothetical protein SAMN05444394_2832 [Algoriphagus halophilus]
MIKFFRKIRQQLLSKNQVSKYLVYAFGEIILVVIGILIALGINNLNQQRINKNTEQIYLQGLEEEFQTSKLKLEELIQVNQGNIDGAKSILTYIADPNNSPGEKEFSELLYQSFSSDIAFNPNNSLLNEMINSGNLKILSNSELRRLLTNWISTLEDIKRQENELDIQREHVLNEFRTEGNSLQTVLKQVGVYQQLDIPIGQKEQSNLKLLSSSAFENNILMFILASYATGEAHYQPLMREMEQILSLIQKEID